MWEKTKATTQLKKLPGLKILMVLVTDLTVVTESGPDNQKERDENWFRTMN